MILENFVIFPLLFLSENSKKVVIELQRIFCLLQYVLMLDRRCDSLKSHLQRGDTRAETLTSPWYSENLFSLVQDETSKRPYLLVHEFQPS